MKASSISRYLLLLFFIPLVISCSDMQLQSSLQMQSKTHPTKMPKPSKTECTQLGYKNYGQCVSAWAHGELEPSFVTHAHNLNVIYFVPNDNPPVEGYHKRLSELLIYFQDYVKSEMKRNGFGEKTFGLPVDKVHNRVKIVTIQGKHGQAYYDYGSGAEILNEIETYRAAHPEDFSSKHSLIILPERTDGGGQPFYGWGRNCFALDNPNIKVEVIETTESNYIGGMLHELGHGLNLPHNQEKVSQMQTLGTALMGHGNYSFGQSPTFITEANAAILNRNQIFQSTPVPDIYESAETTLNPQLSYDKSTQSLHVQGTFTSTKPVSDVLFWVDPKVSDDDADYNSVSWRQADVDDGNFNIMLSFTEIQDHGNWPYQLKIKLLMKNGSINTYSYPFKFVNGVFKLPSKVKVFQHSSYNGWEVELKAGSYTTSELTSLGFVDNDISSIKVPLGLKVTLYAKDNFIGDSYEIGTGNISFLSGFNDVTSSIVISKQ